jgi:hypothetical protein
MLSHSPPESLEWLAPSLVALQRPCMLLLNPSHAPELHDTDDIAPLGGTFFGGVSLEADTPDDAIWAARRHPKWWPFRQRHPWDHKLGRGEHFLLQLDLSDLDPSVFTSEFRVPTQGMIWVTIEPTGDKIRPFQANVYHDPRPSHEIPWRERTSKEPPLVPMMWLEDTLSSPTPATIPELLEDTSNDSLFDTYVHWWMQTYCHSLNSNAQVGGWLEPSQGDIDEQRKTMILHLSNVGFGNGGSVHVHYSEERGFWAEACD